jgi:hypothetical protein
MLEVDSKKRKTFLELSQDDWLFDKSEAEKLQELKRRNYQLKKVYKKTCNKVTVMKVPDQKVDNLTIITSP